MKTQEGAAELASEAFTVALRHIQDALGVTTGDRASHFWSDDREAVVTWLLQEYAEHEIQSAEADRC